LLNCVSRYEEAKSKGIDNYERELEDVIDKLIGECDRKIGRALKRLEDDDAKAAIAISVSEVTQVILEFKIKLFVVVEIDDGFLRVVIMIVLFDLQTPEVFELSKEIKEKLKEADKYGIVITFNFDNM
jgi:hypothetical protein